MNIFKPIFDYFDRVTKPPFDYSEYQYVYSNKCPKCGNPNLFTIALTGGWGDDRPTNSEHCSNCGFDIDHVEEFEKEFGHRIV